MAKKFLKKYGLDSLTLLAAIVVFVFGLTEPGKAMARQLLQESPVLFYAVFIPMAAIFSAWIINKARKWLK